MYSVNIEDNGLLSISQTKDRFSYKIHGLTNFPDYKFTQPFIYLKKNLITGHFVIEESLPKLLKSWKTGNFIYEDGFEYRRLTQYEFDKFCFEDPEFKIRFPDNSKLFEHIKSKN